METGVKLTEEEVLKLMKICYLYIFADGSSSPSELKHLDEIQKKEDLSDYYLDEYNEFCKEIKPKISKGDVDIIIEEIDRVLEGNRLFSFSWTIHGDESSTVKRACILWTLINLGFADSDFSEEEKRIVNHLERKWEMDTTLTAELIDIAETISALTMKEKQLENKTSEKEEIQNNISELFEDALVCVSQAYILKEETQNDEDENDEDEDEYEEDEDEEEPYD